MQYLKPKQYYVDLYDKHTVERCRRAEKRSSDTDVPEAKKVTKREAKAIVNHVNELMLTFEKGERWANKDKTINDWMERDRKKDEFIESANAPEDIRCLTCRNHLKVESKQLWHGGSDEDERILFMYECPNQCLPRRAFFNDGEEWRSKPHLCTKCNNPTKSEVSDDDVKMVTTYTCPSCKYVEVDEYEWSKQEDEYDEHFAADRDRFCLSE